MPQPMKFEGLTPLLGVEQPSKKIQELSPEQAELFLQQFTPFMAAVAENLKFRGVQPDNDLVTILSPKFGGDDRKVTGQITSDFAYVYEESGGFSRAVRWFNGEQSFVVIKKHQTETGNDGNFEINIQFNSNSAEVFFPANY